MLCRLAFALLALLPVAAERAGLVLAVKGKVALQPQGGVERPVRRCDLLFTGDRLSVAAGGEVHLLILGDKHRERLQANAKATLTAAGCTPSEGVQTLAAVAPRLGTSYEGVPDLVSGKVAGGTLRDVFPPVTPIFGARVLGDRPAFSWPAVKGATEYRVRLVRGRLDLLSGREKPLWTAQTKKPQLSYPAQAKPLEFGETYSWYVRARTGPNPEDEVDAWESKFVIPPRETAAELDKVKALTVGKAAPADLMLAALIYYEHGVFDEALKLFEGLAKQSPKEAHLQAALAACYKRAGKPEKAEAALERAKQLGLVLPKD
jgi:hypothetical protein